MTEPRANTGRMRVANRVVVWLTRLGVPFGPVSTITIPGRKTGKPRTTPIGAFVVDGQRYVVAGSPDADWARNARAAGHGVLSSGRRREQITLTEVTDVAERRRIMTAYPTVLPAGARAFQRQGVVQSTDPAAFAAISDRVALFKIDQAKPASAASPADG